MNHKHISSLTNENIKAVTALHQAKYRQEAKKFIAEGTRIIQTLLESKVPLDQLYLVDSAPAEELHASIDHEKITTVTSAIMKKISTASTPSGMLAVFHQPPAPALESLSDGIVLAEIADPGNMGTLMRTAAAMGKSSIVIVGGVDCWNPKVIQASAGTIGKLSIFELSWQQLVEAAKNNNLSLVALVVENGKKPSELSFAKSLLVIGNEAHGLPAAWIADCDATMTLPMPGKIESLNAAIAGSIALYLACEHR